MWGGYVVYNLAVTGNFAVPFFGPWSTVIWYLCPVAAILWGSWSPDPLTFWQCGGPSVHGPPPHFLVPCCSTWLVIHSISYADGVTHADFCTIKHHCEFYKAVWLHKLHQNVWQRVNGLCPDPCGVHDMEGKRRVDGGREVASDLGTDRRHWLCQWTNFYNVVLSYGLA